ncbi:uncharacterized protein IAS62_001706 [Cryptococcus decagattii]|uniref:Uncharacterized protein n=1 Tax=Cryptococcus decagattii TaxID=1859122 RepID=A0ABZ2APF5_9TREE
MSSPFPQLLRRANIATYDPLISRIYTTTPSSQSRHSDWGLKFSIHRTKGPRYIKFNSLDSGPGFDCDWRSAEREARFIQAWGSGKIRWSPEQKQRKTHYATKSTSPFSISESMVEPLLGKKEWVRDVESMSEEDFEKYLERIRAERKQFLKQRLEQMPESTRQTLVHPEDNTLIHLSTSDKLPGDAVPSLESAISAAERSSPSSTKILSRPHQLYGLTYANLPESVQDYNPLTSLPGHTLNTISRHDAAQDSVASPARRGGNNRPWIVSLGGITGKTTPSPEHISFKPNDSVIGVDFTRQKLTDGRGTFKPSHAQIRSPPTVLALAESGAGARWKRKWRSSGASSTGPLNTVQFDLHLSNAPEDGLEIGSREWLVNAEKPATARPSDVLGGLKQARSGNGRAYLEELQRKQDAGKAAAKQGRKDSLQSVQRLLERFKKSQPE